ncbi:hypothetical protein EPN90_02205 [Patescibacteria group bacterium]|nr:MAG: hypothetical protein EPN90_02205 [Patescibacteria group bacterium]
MKIVPLKTPIIQPNASLTEVIAAAIHVLPERSIVVVTSKIVALAQGRVVTNGPGEKTRWIKRESEQAFRTKWCYLTLKDGHWCPNAGIDESNADGKLILWPRDPYRAARELRRFLRQHYRRQRVGVLITDSRTFPLRAGVTGVALGYAGFGGLRSYIGRPDLFGRPLKMTRTNVADTLASAAVLMMGEGSEQTPLALVTDAPVRFTDRRVDPTELRIAPDDDMYKKLFEGYKRKKRKKHG